MNMRSGDDAIEVSVLQIGEPPRRSSRVVIVNEREDAESLFGIVGDDLFDESPAHQPSDGLGSVGIAMPIAITIETLEQIAADRHAESYEGVFHIERSVIFFMSICWYRFNPPDRLSTRSPHPRIGGSIALPTDRSAGRGDRSLSRRSLIRSTRPEPKRLLVSNSRPRPR